MSEIGADMPLAAEKLRGHRSMVVFVSFYIRIRALSSRPTSMGKRLRVRGDILIKAWTGLTHVYSDGRPESIVLSIHNITITL